MENSSVNVYTTDQEDLIIPDVIYDRAIELSVNDNLNDRRTKAERFLRAWAYASPKNKEAIERVVQLRKDIADAIMFGANNASR